MALWWLCYRRGERIEVAIIEAPSLIHAGMRAALLGLDDGARFAQAHMLDAKSAAIVASKEIGRMLTPREARRMIERFEAALQRPARKRKAPP
jgi:hypothetical protein